MKSLDKLLTLFNVCPIIDSYDSQNWNLHVTVNIRYDYACISVLTLLTFLTLKNYMADKFVDLLAWQMSSKLSDITTNSFDQLNQNMHLLTNHGCYLHYSLMVHILDITEPEAAMNIFQCLNVNFM